MKKHELSFAWWALCAVSVACSAPDDGGGNDSGVDSGNDGADGNVDGGTGGGTNGTGGGLQIDPSTGGGAPTEDCESVIDVVYRDFRGGAETDGHIDFEWSAGAGHNGFKGDVVRVRLVEPDLGSDRKPVFLSSTGWGSNATPNAEWEATIPVITSATTFDQWYRTTEGVNQEIEGQIDLAESPPDSGKYIYDSSAFFPLDDVGFGNTPGQSHNFGFTTEGHIRFGYEAGQIFTFRGDDDLWIFVNGKLALDLGSLHMPIEATIDFDARAAELGITPGQTYNMDFFHAERQTDGSNFRFETNIKCFVPVVIPR